jgi:hypothetical protein
MPSDHSLLLAKIKVLRTHILGQEQELTGAFRAETAADFAAMLLGDVPSLEPIWLDAARLGLTNLPEWEGEPKGKPEAVKMLDDLAAVVGKREEFRADSQAGEALNVAEQNVLEALGPNTLKGPAIASNAGYCYEYTRQLLASLKRRNLIAHTSEGYRRL